MTDVLCKTLLRTARRPAPQHGADPGRKSGRRRSCAGNCRASCRAGCRPPSPAAPTACSCRPRTAPIPTTGSSPRATVPIIRAWITTPAGCRRPRPSIGAWCGACSGSCCAWAMSPWRRAIPLAGTAHACGTLVAGNDAGALRGRRPRQGAWHGQSVCRRRQRAAALQPRQSGAHHLRLGRCGWRATWGAGCWRRGRPPRNRSRSAWEHERWAWTSNCPQVVRFGREICGDLAAGGAPRMVARQRPRRLRRRHRRRLADAPLPRSAGGAGGSAAGTRAWCSPRPTPRWSTANVASAAVHQPLGRRGGGAGRPCAYRVVPPGRAHAGVALRRRRPVASSSASGWSRVPTPPTSPSACCPARRRWRAPLRLRVTLLVNARDHHGSSRPWDFNPVIEGDGAAAARASSRTGSRCTCKRAGRRHRTAPRLVRELRPAAGARARPAATATAICASARRTLDLSPGEWVGVVASLEADAAALPRRSDAAGAGARRGQPAARPGAGCPSCATRPAWVDQLVLAADSFVFARPLPERARRRVGDRRLSLVRRLGPRHHDRAAGPDAGHRPPRHGARASCATFARFVDRGMLPNVFPGAGDAPEYNTADAALWYVEAWRAYVEASGDVDGAARGVPGAARRSSTGTCAARATASALDAADGLLRAGEPGVQLTWMDAKIGDWVVTPRIGKPVEINALWFNALMAMAAVRRTPGRAGGAVPQRWRRRRAPASSASSWRDGARPVRRARRPGRRRRDAAAEPDLRRQPARIRRWTRRRRQRWWRVSAASCSPPTACARSIRPIATIRPHYLGGVWERDGAYHQGPVWGWLLGHYALARVPRARRCRRRAGAARAAARPPAGCRPRHRERDLRRRAAPHAARRARRRPGRWPARWRPGGGWQRAQRDDRGRQHGQLVPMTEATGASDRSAHGDP